ncbi:MAG: hypothetical protein OSB69_07045 [Alphaproteobacteria bacterium]|jgi:hypothetical protein|nr:hypothetical protein [Alphaproteobacteria bacterium]
MFKLQNFLKRYVWDDETTPYFIKVANLSRSQADSELFFFAIMLAILFGIATFTSITGQAPYGVSQAAAIYCFTIVSAAVLVGTVKNFYAAIYTASVPVVVILALLFLGFPKKMVLIDQVVLVAIDLALLYYMWRVIMICRVYNMLPRRAPANKTRRRLF